MGRSAQERFEEAMSLGPQERATLMNYRLSASGFLTEVDRTQLEVREYLSLHPTDLKATA